MFVSWDSGMEKGMGDFGFSGVGFGRSESAICVRDGRWGEHDGGEHDVVVHHEDTRSKSLCRGTAVCKNDGRFCAPWGRVWK